MDAADIVATNALTDETLVIGQVLIIPGGRGAPIPTPKPTRRPVVRVATVSRPSSSSRSSATRARPVLRRRVRLAGRRRVHQPVLPLRPPGARHRGGLRHGAFGPPPAGPSIFAGWKSNGGGYQVWIAHGGGLYTTYNHMSSLAVSYGEGVGRGDFIGRIGTSGWATGSHLHFEVWHGEIWSGGYRVNPLSYL